MAVPKCWQGTGGARVAIKILTPMDLTPEVLLINDAPVDSSWFSGCESCIEGSGSVASVGTPSGVLAVSVLLSVCCCQYAGCQYLVVGLLPLSVLALSVLQVVAFHGVTLTPPSMCLVMEHCERGSLKDFLKTCGKLTWPRRVSMMLQAPTLTLTLTLMSP